MNLENIQLHKFDGAGGKSTRASWVIPKKLYNNKTNISTSFFNSDFEIDPIIQNINLIATWLCSKIMHDCFTSSERPWV